MHLVLMESNMLEIANKGVDNAVSGRIYSTYDDVSQKVVLYLRELIVTQAGFPSRYAKMMPGPSAEFAVEASQDSPDREVLHEGSSWQIWRIYYAAYVFQTGNETPSKEL